MTSNLARIVKTPLSLWCVALMFRLLWQGVSPSGLSVIICEREDGKKPLGLIDQFLTTQEKTIAPV